MEEKFILQVSLIKKEADTPLTDTDLTVWFYDKDAISDDNLGYASLDEDGTARISIVPSDFRSADSPLESMPDLYFKLYRKEELLFTSPVIDNADLRSEGDFDSRNGWVYDLGSFLVDVK